MKEHEKVVQQIVSLPWQSLDEKGMLSLMVCSAYSATEFAESLRIAIKLNPKHKPLAEMAKGELKTDNISFGDYHDKGDHSQFLWHFIEKEKVRGIVSPKIFHAGEKYLVEVRKLPNALRAMSIFSREKEMMRIFMKILERKKWNHPALRAYQHYLQRHIELDSQVGGHRDLTAEFPVTDEVEKFYLLRLKLYEQLFM